MKKLAIVSMALFLVLLCCCETSKPPTQTTTPEQPTPQVSKEDLDVEYQGITISDSVDLTEIADKLNFGLDAWYDDGEYIAACGSNIPGDKDRYVYYRAKYPNKESTDLEFVFWYNQTKNELMTLSSISLLSEKARTNRGVTVGDDESTLKVAYHNDIRLWLSQEEYIYGKTSDDYFIFFSIDPTTRKITEITINYNSSKAMEELGIDGFD